MRYQGRITLWKDEKGFGFITQNGDDDRVFLHISAFRHRQRRPKENDLVTYEVTIDDKKRRQARSVAFVRDRVAPGKSPTYSGKDLLISLSAFGFLCIVVAMTILGWLPTVTPWVYGIASFVTFFAYAFDKSAAIGRRWRTRENTLHLFSLVGGWPGALLAQRFIRHKSAKDSFQSLFWLTVLVNCGVLGWLLSPPGKLVFQQIFGSD